MDKTKIKVSCIDQVLKITESPILASGGLSEVRVVFSFCEKWNGFEKTAIFYRDDEPVYYSILDENDTCVVPWEVCYEEGTFKFGVFGDKGVTRRTSLEVKYKVKKGAITADTMPSDPTPAVYDQIMSLLGEMRESQAGFISVAEKAVVDANTATQEAQTATANANKATQDANTAADNANTEAGKAAQAAVDANAATNNANKATSDARTATEETNTTRENIQQTAHEVLTELSNAVYAPPIECCASGEVVSVSDASNQLLRGLTIYGKTVQNGTPTPSAPVALESVGESIGVTVAGKNLLPCAERTEVKNGVTFASNADGITANGTATEQCYFLVDTFVPSVSGKYIVSGCPSGGNNNQYNVQVERNSVRVCDDFGSGAVVDLEAGGSYKFYAVVRIGYTANNLTFKPMIRLASVTDATYEPYKVQTLTAAAEGGLHGIGEVKDEIDFARGIRGHKTHERFFNGTEPWQAHNKEFTIHMGNNPAINDSNSVNCICSHYEGKTRNQLYNYQNNNSYTGIAVSDAFIRIVDNVNGNGDVDMFKAFLAQQYANGNPVTVRYVLAEPIETPLTADELSAFATLHSNKPNTTVFNDSGAEMKLSYVADTKLYIDQKIAAISAALLNT